MKAVLVHQVGGPEVLDYVDVPRPKTGLREVHIRAEAFGVGQLDVLIRRGDDTRKRIGRPSSRKPMQQPDRPARIFLRTDDGGSEQTDLPQRSQWIAQLGANALTY